MKAYVDKNTCIGCGLCTSIAPSIFELDDNGLAENVLGNEVPSELENAVNEAAQSCPVGAIKTEQ